ncbi:hypothetical protein Tco_1079205 [Tanacetum coccineum]|uniref:Uncharacterized protein n=1 Tax=Tanacetum coccineum TaxID=301880 RepID=A0ABQ5HSR2_9ASTR
MYHKKNIDYAYLLWEDFVYQVENKNVKKSNEMYYPRFTKVIINFFMTKDQSIPRRNSVNWHYAKDDYMLTTIKVVSRHEDTQLYGAILPNELMNKDIRNSESYKEYYVIASGAKPPKTKARVKKKQVGSDMLKTPPTKGKRLKTSAKAAKTTKKKQPAKTSKAKCLTVLSKKSSEDDDDDDEVNVSDDNDDDADNDDDVDKDDDKDGADNPDDAHQDDDDEQTDSDNDGDDFVHPKLSTHDDEARQDDEEEEMDEEPTHEDDEANELYIDMNINLEGRDTEMTDAPLPNSSSVSSGFVSNMLNPSPDTGIDLIFTLNTEATSLVDVLVTTIVEPPLLSATTLPPPPTPLITHLQQTLVPTPATVPSSSLQDFPTLALYLAVSFIPGIVDAYLANKMHEAVKTIVQLQFERLRDEAQAKNANFLNKLEDNIKKIIKDQTSHVVAANLSELELKKILIDKMKSNKRRDNEDKDEEPSAGSNRGSKRRQARKEPESTSTPKENTSKISGKSYEGSKYQHKTTGEFTQTEEPMHTTKDLEEPSHQEFETGVIEDQHNEETPQFPDWFQRPTKLPSSYRDWNKTLPDAHGPVQPWLSSLA